MIGYEKTMEVLQTRIESYEADVKTANQTLIELTKNNATLTEQLKSQAEQIEAQKK